VKSLKPLESMPMAVLENVKTKNNGIDIETVQGADVEGAV
jgi:hypothetical protein